MKWLVLLCAGLLAQAQSGIAPPQIGFVLNSDQTVRPLIGFAGNLISGDSIFEGVLSTASSASWTLVKTPSTLVASDLKHNFQFSLDTDDGKALFAFSQDGVPALVFLPGSNTLQQWRTDHFEWVRFFADSLGGDPVAIARPTENWVRFVIRRPDGFWQLDLSTQDGSILGQTALPRIQGSVLLQADGSLIYLDQSSLVIGSRRIELGSVGGELRSIGDGWVQVGQLAVRITPGHEQVSQFPEVAPCCEN